MSAERLADAAGWQTGCGRRHAGPSDPRENNDEGERFFHGWCGSPEGGEPFMGSDGGAGPDITGASRQYPATSRLS